MSDPINTAENAASAASEAQAVLNDYESLANEAKNLDYQARQLQAELDQLKNLDVRTLDDALNAQQRLGALRDRARNIGYQFDSVGRQFDRLYGRVNPDASSGAPYEALKKAWEKERDQADRELLEVQAHSAEHNKEIARRQKELYPKLNKAQNAFQSGKLNNELQALQSAQLQQLIELQIANSRANQLRELERSRKAAAARIRSGKNMASMAERQDASAPISNGQVKFSDQGAALVGKKRMHRSPKAENVNFMLRDQMKAIATRSGTYQTKFLILLAMLGTLSIVWSVMSTAWNEDKKWEEEFATSCIKLGILTTLLICWGDVADAIYSYVVSTGSNLGGGSVSTMNPANIATAGFGKVETLFSAEAYRQGTIVPNMDLPEGWGMFSAEGLEGVATLVTSVFAAFFCAIVIILIHFYVGWMVFVVQIEFMVTCAIAKCFIPFGMNPHTQFAFNSAFTGVINSGVKLATLACVVGLMGTSMNAVSIGPSTSLRQLFDLLFICGTFAFLVLHSPAIAASIFSGAGGGFNAAGATTQIASGVVSAGSAGVSAVSNFFKSDDDDNDDGGGGKDSSNDSGQQAGEQGANGGPGADGTPPGSDGGTSPQGPGAGGSDVSLPEPSLADVGTDGSVAGGDVSFDLGDAPSSVSAGAQAIKKGMEEL